MSSSLNRRKIVTFDAAYHSRIDGHKNSEISQQTEEGNDEFIEENGLFPQLMDLNQHLNEPNQQIGDGYEQCQNDIVNNILVSNLVNQDFDKNADGRHNDVSLNHCSYVNEDLSDDIENHDHSTHDDINEHSIHTNNPDDLKPDTRLTANIDERIPVRFLHDAAKWKFVFAAKVIAQGPERGRRDLERQNTLGGIPRRFWSRESLDIVEKRDGEEELQAVLERIPTRFRNIKRLKQLDMDVNTLVY